MVHPGVNREIAGNWPTLLRNTIQAAMNAASDELRTVDDGLICPEVGPWAETKYRLVALYAELFSTGMKDKWDRRVYIDLYAGAGYSRIHGTSTVLKGSPILALTVKHPFDKYIFCEESRELIGALQARAKRIAGNADIDYMLGDCNSEIQQVCALVPKASPRNTVLSLCFVDPFDFGIKFETLRKLSNFYVDFLVLLAIGWMRIAITTATWKASPPKLTKL